MELHQFTTIQNCSNNIDVIVDLSLSIVFTALLCQRIAPEAVLLLNIT